MEKIDILLGTFVASVGGNGLADSVMNKFTANTGVNEVSFDISTAPLWYFIFNKPDSGAKYFNARDNIRILSYGIWLPHGFTSGKIPLRMQLDRVKTVQAGGTLVESIPELRDSNALVSNVIFPFANFETALDVYSEFPAQTTVAATNPTKYLIRGLITAGDVSMLNAASASNGQVYCPVPFIKVLHTSEMTVA
jgi:hypothetical protein